MDLSDEINRRVKILNDFDKRVGVKVEFLGTPDKYYTYLSNKQVEPGIYFKNTDMNKTMKYDIFRVIECGHDVLYATDDATLNILRRKAANFEFSRAETILHEAHTNAISILANLNEYRILNAEALVKETLFNGEYKLYMEAIRNGESYVDFVLPVVAAKGNK